MNINVNTNHKVKEVLNQFEGQYDIVSVCHEVGIDKYEEEDIDVENIMTLRPDYCKVVGYKEYCQSVNENITESEFAHFTGSNEGKVLLITFNEKVSVVEAMQNYGGLEIEEIEGDKFLVGFDNFEDLKDVESSTKGDAVAITKDYRRGYRGFEILRGPIYDRAEELVNDCNYIRVYYKPECTEDNILEDAKSDISELIEDEELDANELLEKIQEIKETYQKLVDEFYLLEDDEVLVVGDTLEPSCIEILKRFPMEWETTLYRMKYGVKIR